MPRAAGMHPIWPVSMKNGFHQSNKCLWLFRKRGVWGLLVIKVTGGAGNRPEKGGPLHVPLSEVPALGVVLHLLPLPLGDCHIPILSWCGAVKGVALDPLKVTLLLDCREVKIQAPQW